MGVQEIHILVWSHPAGQSSKTLCPLAVLLLLQWSDDHHTGSKIPSIPSWLGCWLLVCPVLSSSGSSCCWKISCLPRPIESLGVGRVTTFEEQMLPHKTAAGGRKGPETCQLLPGEPESSPLPGPGSCGAGISGMSMPLMTLWHLSEPFPDGLASFPKGVPPSHSTGSRQAGG